MTTPKAKRPTDAEIDRANRVNILELLVPEKSNADIPAAKGIAVKHMIRIMDANPNANQRQLYMLAVQDKCFTTSAITDALMDIAVCHDKIEIADRLKPRVPADDADKLRTQAEGPYRPQSKHDRGGSHG